MAKKTELTFAPFFNEETGILTLEIDLTQDTGEESDRGNTKVAYTNRFMDLGELDDALDGFGLSLMVTRKPDTEAYDPDNAGNQQEDDKKPARKAPTVKKGAKNQSGQDQDNDEIIAAVLKALGKGGGKAKAETKPPKTETKPRKTAAHG